MAHESGAHGLSLDERHLAEFGTAVASLYVTLYNEAPAGVKSFTERDALVCRIQGGLTAGDMMMLQHGHSAELAAYRDGFFRAVAGQFEMAVFAYTGHDVLAQQASFDPATVSTELRFELSPPIPDDAEQREALRNWAEQVRRSSRRLKAMYSGGRESRRVLAKRLHEEPEKGNRGEPG